MTFKFTNDETGNEFNFSSEAQYERAMEWYNGNTKGAIIQYCAQMGFDLSEETDDPYFKNGKKLADDWADIAMEIWARNNDS